MFFDNSKFFAFKDLCEKKGIDVPIIPGLKPISTLKQMNLIPHRFHCDLPEDLIKSLIKCKDNSQARQVGIEWCIQQSKELMEARVPFLHWYSKKLPFLALTIPTRFQTTKEFGYNLKILPASKRNFSVSIDLKSLNKFLSSRSGIASSVKSTCEDVKFCKAF